MTSFDNWPRPSRGSKSSEHLAHGRVCEGGVLHPAAGRGRREFSDRLGRCLFGRFLQHRGPQETECSRSLVPLISLTVIS